MRHPIVAYLILVLALFTALTIGAHRQDRVACKRSEAVATNQRVVLRTLISDRTGTDGLFYANQPRRRESRAELERTLARTPVFACRSWLPFGL